jgi:protoporphyrinogen oxidase
MDGRKALIIGAGPAGLTAAFELLQRSAVQPVVLEKSQEMGGLSRTVRYKGNRMDIGGHRFFSKSDRVMRWWMERMPVEGSAGGEHNISYRGQTRMVESDGVAPDPQRDDHVMLIRQRKSRIYFLRQFFEYPITLSGATLKNLGLWRAAKIGVSYLASIINQRKPEKTLEDFFINRFGKELYGTFFKSYTEKVWGVSCRQISAEWGAQRVKGLSVLEAIAHFLKKSIHRKPDGGISQKGTETSLIERFMYPKFGPGQLWEHVADDVRRGGGCVETGWSVDKLYTQGFRITAAEAVHAETGERQMFEADYFFSTMPVKELMRCLQAEVPENVREVSEGLQYRDFITVGLLLNRLKISEKTPQGEKLLADNWIYIQEPDVAMGRMQIFNNWSPWLVADPETVWIGVEYFCYETDELWKLADDDMIGFAKREMAKIGIIDEGDVRDACVIRVPKTYPAYFGAYERFEEIRHYVDRFENLFLIGRNGMHKYNNQDHSMLTAMTAVDNLIAGRLDKSNIWALNTEMEYHEERNPAEKASE